MSRSVDLRIDSIGAGGDGVGRADGLVVFVPRSAPGDVGRVRIQKAGRFARAQWESILHPGPARIEPSCRHYVVHRCGGCQLQHLAYGAQLEAKGDIIRDALQRIGKQEAIRPTVRPSPQQWRYRRKLTLAMRRQTATDTWITGLHPYDDPEAVFDLQDCPITDERVVGIWAQIRGAARWLPRDDRLRGAVRAPASGEAGATSFLLEGGRQWTTHREFFDAIPSVDSLWWQPDDQSRRRLGSRTKGSDIGRNGPREVQMAGGEGNDMVGIPSEPDPADASFIQVNAAVAAELQRHVVSLAIRRQPSSVVDAYAGSGDTAVPLADAGIIVTAIELDREAAARGASRLRMPSRMIQARVEDALPELLPADLVIVNPPRLGLHERVPLALSSGSAPDAVIYVSCNPATLARDVARLPGYRIASVTAFDMFPQTAHVETVCELVRSSA